ncbi:DEAD/DEAH box helicase [Bradyrhizobium sp. SZCCHNRI3018]|uniref:DEAD/DEAH box helicase n=1 Tax=Bradyrhizobium sp. SZCCHNRI3018 TaxID=3057289 RepID=UPI00291640E9|nr:DEAD/DEAH box helicase [Bradyrhizobium sp. SZCCHNRI3018]
MPTEFIQLLVRVLGADRDPNPGQRACLEQDLGVPLLIVAGPGTGKTTVLVLRALRAVLVDRVPPECIMITTFTRKAANEIRTRLIEWGIPLQDSLLAPDSVSRLAPDYVEFLRGVDINRFITGTLDSICEESLTASRLPNERPLVVIETFAANQLLARRGEVFAASRRTGQAFADYLGRYSLTGDPPTTVGDMTRIVRTIIDRFVQDEVDIDQYLAPGTDLEARRAVKQIFDNYRNHLVTSGQMDFPLLEKTFLDRVVARNIPDRLADLRVLLVDEYQDTNPLQEHIYLELARATGASLTVVGDDDQSLYRFRGATIELFRDFVARASAFLGGAVPRTLYLTENYRSTPEIIAFFNSFAQNDPDFLSARIQPPKPAIVDNLPSNGVPVLGLFRDDADELAVDLADFLNAIFRGGGRPADTLLSESIERGRAGGDFGDAVLLSSTVSEFTRPFMGRPARPRLAWRLRTELAARGVQCFNPRGRALKDVEQVALMLGLVLEALDPSTASEPNGLLIAGMTGITNVARNAFREWRNAAAQFLATRPPPVNNKTIADVLVRWRNFAAAGRGASNEWPVLDVLYSFMPWVPAFQDDPECQVYLEAISRCAAEAATYSAYRALLIRHDRHRTLSIQAAIRDVMAPIADDLVEVDEEIMSSVPRDRFNLMTIHQAKGLEFPLVVVDVSSDFKINSPAQKFRRFPEDPSSVTLLEDDLAACTPIGQLRMARSALQRSFEDIVRLYYVAYSRPQSVLLLVGCIPGLRYTTQIKNVAKFWRADSTWPWIRPYAGRRPPTLANNLPFNML